MRRHGALPQPVVPARAAVGEGLRGVRVRHVFWALFSLMEPLHPSSLSHPGSHRNVPRGVGYTRLIDMCIGAPFGP